MAKPPRRRQSYSETFRHGLRDDYYIANPFDRIFEPIFSGLPDQTYRGPVDLSEVEDRRTFHPDQDDRPVRSSRRSAVTSQPNHPSRARARAAARAPALHNVVASVFQTFRYPSSVAICIRRKMRDEVLHALGKTGKGSGRPRRRNANSKIRC